MKVDKKLETKLKSLLDKYARRTEDEIIELVENTNDDEIEDNDEDWDTESDNDSDEDDDKHDDKHDSDIKKKNLKDIEKERVKTYKFYYKIVKTEDLESLNDNNNNDDDSDDDCCNDDGCTRFKTKIINKNEKHIIINLYDETLTEALQKISELSTVYETQPYITLKELFYCINSFRNSVEDQNESIFKNMLGFVEEIFKDDIKKMDNMIRDGLIDYDSLWYYFDKTDKLYIVKELEHDICIKQKAFSYNTRKVNFFALHAEIITIYQKKLYISEYRHKIKKFKGLKQIKSFDVKDYDSQKMDFITNGTKILSMYDKIKHGSAIGKQWRYGQNNIVQSFYINETIMIDHEGGEQLGYNIPYSFDKIDIIDEEHIKDDDKVIIYPFITIYNLGTSKKWGICHVNNIKLVTYNKEAFDYLVLDENKKKIIVGLIKNYRIGIEDFIESKGKGLVFLLYGPPGVGKTLSAEATSELLEQPLFNMNVGDLGTHPDTMEHELYSIGQFIKRWDAILLIDEVDIFLENREESDITRNAMVCIFLKFLEYHDNIIFLTTNRVRNMDPAIKSRINLFLAYDELTPNMRRQIWKSLMTKWNIAISNNVLDDLGEFKLNGREIRNYLKLAISIHKEEKKEITNSSLISTLKNCFTLTQEFATKAADHMYN